MKKKVTLKKAERVIVIQSRTEELNKEIEAAFQAGDAKLHLRLSMELLKLKGK